MARPAGFALRLTAWVLDLVAAAGLTPVLGRYEVGLLPGVSSIDTEAQAAGLLLFVFWLTLAFYHLIEIVTGRSPAKWLIGLRVVRLDSGRAGIGRRAARGLMNLVPILIVTGIWVFAGSLPVRISWVAGIVVLIGFLPTRGAAGSSFADRAAQTSLIVGRPTRNAAD